MRLREPDALPHAFAVAGRFAVGRIAQAHAIDRLPCEFSSHSASSIAEEPQIGVDELIAGQPFGERIELRAVADKLKQLFRLDRRNAPAR